MTLTASGSSGKNHLDIYDNTIAMDWPSDAWKVAVFNNTITTPDPDANPGWAYAVAPFNANEVAGVGYTAGGIALASPTLTLASPAATQLKFDANDTAWVTSTWGPARGALIYDTTVSNKGLFVITFGADFSVTGGTFTIIWNVSGIAYLDYA